MDFVHDTLIGILSVVDDYTRESLCLTADMALPSGRVIRDLEAVIARRGLPTQCVSDNGPEFTSLARLHWMRGLRIDWRYIDSSKPQPNAFVESFNSRLRTLERDAVHFAHLGACRAQGVAARLQYRTVTSLACNLTRLPTPLASPPLYNRPRRRAQSRASRPGLLHRRT